MKTYVPDPEKWVQYFEDKTKNKKPAVVPIQPVKKIIPIETTRPVISKRKALVKIEPITPVQQLEERVKAELKRNHKSEQRGGSNSVHVPRKKQRITCVDTSGF